MDDDAEDRLLNDLTVFMLNVALLAPSAVRRRGRPSDAEARDYIREVARQDGLSVLAALRQRAAVAYLEAPPFSHNPPKPADIASVVRQLAGGDGGMSIIKLRRQVLDTARQFYRG